MSKLTARDHLFSCAIGEGNLQISRGLRSIPREWSLSDLREKTDDELLALTGLGDTTLNFIKSFLRGEFQERAWKGIRRQIEAYSKAYPNTFIHVHHESVPENCTSPFERAFDNLYREMGE